MISKIVTARMTDIIRVHLKNPTMQQLSFETFLPIKLNEKSSTIFSGITPKRSGISPFLK
jgi:hypothetical protein